MKPRFIFLSACIPFCWLVLNACQFAQSSNEYIVEGVVRDSSANGKTIYIMDYDAVKFIDSTMVKDNRFVFKGKVDTITFCRINVTQEESGKFILEPGHILVNLIGKRPYEESFQPSGTPQNDEMARLDRAQDSINAQIRQKRKELLKICGGTTSEFNTQWVDYIQKQREANVEWVMDLFETHNNDGVGYYLLQTIMDGLPIEQKLSILHNLGPWLKSTRYAQNLLKNTEGLANTQENMPYVEIIGKDVSDEDIALSSFFGKGNYVLVDFWSSWCGACRLEFPNLMKLYKQYKDKGLNIVGIYVWDDPENVANAIKSLNITWPQIIDTTRTTATTQYGVSGIPQIILFAPDGTILKRDLRGENMIKTVEDILNKR